MCLKLILVLQFSHRPPPFSPTSLLVKDSSTPIDHLPDSITHSPSITLREFFNHPIDHLPPSPCGPSFQAYLSVHISNVLNYLPPTLTQPLHSLPASLAPLSFRRLHHRPLSLPPSLAHLSLSPVFCDPIYSPSHPHLPLFGHSTPYDTLYHPNVQISSSFQRRLPPASLPHSPLPIISSDPTTLPFYHPSLFQREPQVFHCLIMVSIPFSSCFCSSILLLLIWSLFFFSF